MAPPDGYVNVGCSHWIVCDRHKTRWFVGESLFSRWQDETQETWDGNVELLRGYRAVEPLRFGRSDAEVAEMEKFLDEMVYDDAET